MASTCIARPAVSAVPGAKRLAARKKGVSPGEASGTTRDAWNQLGEGDNTDVGQLAYR
jgi:hypothetical protein